MGMGVGVNEHELTETLRNYEAGKITEKELLPRKITNISLCFDGELTPEEEAGISRSWQMLRCKY